MDPVTRPPTSAPHQKACDGLARRHLARPAAPVAAHTSRSTFLPTFAQRGLLCALLVRPRSPSAGSPPRHLQDRRLRRVALGRPLRCLLRGLCSCRRSPPPTGLPFTSPAFRRSAPNHVCRRSIVWSRQLTSARVSGFATRSRLAATPPSGSSPTDRPFASGSPTPPRDDAVTFTTELWLPDTALTVQTAPSRATSADFPSARHLHVGLVARRRPPGAARRAWAPRCRARPAARPPVPDRAWVYASDRPGRKLR